MLGPSEQAGSASRGAPAARLSESEFAGLFRDSARSLWCIAVAVLRDRTAAEDVVQDAAMIALSKRHEFEVGTSFAAWAGQIVRFTALNELRKRQRERATALDSGLGVAARNGSASGPGFASDMDPKLASAMETLDETARACLLMRTVMGLGYKEIAAALGIPEGTAMSHVHRSRQTLRTLLGASHLSGAGGKGGQA